MIAFTSSVRAFCFLELIKTASIISQTYQSDKESYC